jgi:xanthine dehydrogenase YagT iron-sulfur-binding subunit
VSLQVNGRRYELLLDPRVSLLDCLRDHLHLTGTKKGCDQGACGACTVLLDGERINACLALALQCQDAEITTIEGLGVDRVGSAVQAAFVTRDGLQCGYCTPGQICSVVAMLAEADAGSPSAVTHVLAGDASPLTDAEIKERMAGNLCRCGAYMGICAAIRDVHGRVAR